MALGFIGFEHVKKASSTQRFEHVKGYEGSARAHVFLVAANMFNEPQQWSKNDC